MTPVRDSFKAVWKNAKDGEGGEEETQSQRKNGANSKPHVTGQRREGVDSGYTVSLQTREKVRRERKSRRIWPVNRTGQQRAKKIRDKPPSKTLVPLVERKLTVVKYGGSEIF